MGRTAKRGGTGGVSDRRRGQPAAPGRRKAPPRRKEGREEGPAAAPALRRREAAMPLYEGLGSGGEKTAVVIDLGEAFTK